MQATAHGVAKSRTRLSDFTFTFKETKGLPGGASGKESMCNAGDATDVGSIPGLGRSPRGKHGNQLQYSCLENPMDRGT